MYAAWIFIQICRIFFLRAVMSPSKIFKLTFPTSLEIFNVFSSDSSSISLWFASHSTIVNEGWDLNIFPRTGRLSLDRRSSQIWRSQSVTRSQEEPPDYEIRFLARLTRTRHNLWIVACSCITCARGTSLESYVNMPVYVYFTFAIRSVLICNPQRDRRQHVMLSHRLLASANGTSGSAMIAEVLRRETHR